MLHFTSPKGQTVKNKEFAHLLAQRMGADEETAAKWLEAVIATLYDCFKDGRCVTWLNFGNFYLSERRDGRAFRFNPAQKLRALLGWSSTPKKEV